MTLFAFSNGYFGTLAMMFGPIEVLPHEKEMAGNIMTFFLILGIFIGSHLSLLILYLVVGTIGIN